MHTVGIRGFGRDVPSQVLLQRFKRYAQPRAADDFMTACTIEALVLLCSFLHFKSDSMASCRRLISTIRDSDILNRGELWRLPSAPPCRKHGSRRNAHADS